MPRRTATQDKQQAACQVLPFVSLPSAGQGSISQDVQSSLQKLVQLLTKKRFQENRSHLIVFFPWRAWLITGLSGSLLHHLDSWKSRQFPVKHQAQPGSVWQKGVCETETLITQWCFLLSVFFGCEILTLWIITHDYFSIQHLLYENILFCPSTGIIRKPEYPWVKTNMWTCPGEYLLVRGSLLQLLKDPDK